MTARAPAAMAAANGGRSRLREHGESTSIRATMSCVSVRVLPWPGKCLAQAATPAACSPRHRRGGVPGDQVRVGAEGADADDRVVGAVFTSADGARSRLMPQLGQVVAERAVTARVSAGSSTAPSAALPGYGLPVR